jgi:hypothetical protein
MTRYTGDSPAIAVVPESGNGSAAVGTPSGDGAVMPNRKPVARHCYLWCALFVPPALFCGRISAKEMP